MTTERITIVFCRNVSFFFVLLLFETYDISCSNVLFAFRHLGSVVQCLRLKEFQAAKAGDA